MRNPPRAEGSSGSTLHSRRITEQTINRQRLQNQSSYERSVGYKVAPEASGSDMGAVGTLQIWPKVSNQTYLQLHDTERRPYHRTISDSAATTSTKSGDDVMTASSYNTTPRTPYTVSQQSSMSSVRDMALRKAHPTIHGAISHPNFHLAKGEPKRRDTFNTSEKASHPRSQRLGLSKLFHSSKDKEAKKAAMSSKSETRINERVPGDKDLYHVRVPGDKDLYHVRAMVKSMEPQQQPAVIQRSHNTTFERNATENAKVNVRRPPKGIKHWFEGLDDSDDDFPEVVQTPPEHITTATFRPSLGPSRQRAAPTSRISPMAESSQDYFMFRVADNHRADSHHVAPASQAGRNLQERSMLNLSSSDDDDVSEPPSPEHWPEQQNGRGSLRPSDHFRRSKSDDAGASVVSAQTMMTSGTIPIINADSLYRTPLPRPRETSVAAESRGTRNTAEATVSRNRATTTQSIPSSVASDVSAATDSTTHVMTVTQEEMVLLEMMRRKRAEMHHDGPSPEPQQQPYRAQQHTPVRPRGFERQNSATISIASSTVSRDSDRSVLGTVFPAPPSTDRRCSGNSSIRASEHRSVSGTEDKFLAYVEEEDEKHQPSDPESPVCHELEAPLEHLPALTYRQRPLVEPTASTQKKKTGIPPPPYNSADPYQLAPDLDFSPLDLLPLPVRAYSPSLTTSRSSIGAGSQFSAKTPTDGNSASGPSQGLGVTVTEPDHEAEARVEPVAANSQICELDVKRNSHFPGAGEDVLAAWGALGGV